MVLMANKRVAIIAHTQLGNSLYFNNGIVTTSTYGLFKRIVLAE